MPADRPPLTRSAALALAWPVVGAQAATAMTSVVDTAVMGRVGRGTDLAAVAVASVAFSFLYWGFGFLRMATTGLTAQALGASDRAEGRAVLGRALVLGAFIGTGLIATFPITRRIALWLFGAEAAVEAGAGAYLDARIFGAPAALMGYAVTGWLLGMGRTRALLALQIVLNATNAALDATFVGALGWGPAGIGAGTAIAEWTALLFGLWWVRDGLDRSAPLWDRAKLRALLSTNVDIAVRTLALLFAFGWFVDSGARTSTAALAGNQVLLQFIAVSAFVLDAFAFIAEGQAGEAIGASDRRRLLAGVRVTSELALAFGLAFGGIYLVAGPSIVTWMVADGAARAQALAYLPYCAVVPVIGVAAWQLDGVFLGATQGPALRTAAVVSTALYIATDCLLAPDLGNTGVWIAFVAMYVYRAASLAWFWPRLIRSIG